MPARLSVVFVALFARLKKPLRRAGEEREYIYGHSLSVKCAAATHPSRWARYTVYLIALGRTEMLLL